MTKTLTPFLVLLAAVLMVPAQAARVGVLDHYDRQIIASVLVLEAASDGLEGMTAVLNVIANRADRDPHRMLREAVRPKQFSAINSATGQRQPDYSRVMARAQRDPMYARAIRLVLQFEEGRIEDNTNGATFYHHVRLRSPHWAHHKVYLGTIGSHHFFRAPVYTGYQRNRSDEPTRG